MRYINAVAISQYAFPLAVAEVARQGEIAAGDSATGKILPAAVSTTQIPIGFFMDEAIGDDTKTVTVRLFEETWAYRCANDVTTPVLNAFQTVYLQDGGTVSALATGTSVAGIALEVSSEGVLVVFRKLGVA